ncbi:MAG: hypothetical protein OEW11_08535 [Nitrospirota bacterium]|nr:hypothetical protein [Nitrospirota bacterium]
MRTPFRITPRLWQRPASGLLAAACAALLLAAGCASAPKPLPEPVPDMQRVWPVPPDAPRVAFLRQIAVPADIGIQERGARRLFRAVVGKEKPPRVENPTGLYADADGWLLVADTGLQVVHIFNLKKPSYAQAFRIVGDDRLASPVGVAFDAAGQRIFVSDSILNKIFLYRTDGRLIGWFGEGLVRPSGLVWDAVRGRLIAADTGNHRVLVFDGDGHLLRAIGQRGDGEGQFNFPTHVALDGDGNIFVSDSLNFRVEVFGSEGDYLRHVGQLGDSVGSFAKPKGVALAADGTLFVVDGIYDVVQMFGADGGLLMHFGEAGSRPGALWLPIGVAVAGDDVFVADTHNNRIQVFRRLPPPAQPAEAGQPAGTEQATDPTQAEESAEGGNR